MTWVTLDHGEFLRLIHSLKIDPNFMNFIQNKCILLFTVQIPLYIVLPWFVVCSVENAVNMVHVVKVHKNRCFTLFPEVCNKPQQEGVDGIGVPIKAAEKGSFSFSQPS